MANQKRKMKRQQKQMLEFKNRPKVVNLANKQAPVVTPSVNQASKDAVQMVGQQAYFSGLSKGLQTMTLFSIDCLELTMEETKGIGEKKSQEMRTRFHEALHRKELFDNFMAEEPKGEVFIVNKEEQEFIKLLRHVESVVYDKENSLLTIRDLLSILNHTETPIEELTSIINRLKGVTAE